MSSLQDTVFDVAIIGGGINGAGVARDCAMRRLSVAFFEKNDLCAGSTGACTGMIHGGPRYLETERETTRKSCEDSAVIQKIAPNLLFRIPILIPVLKSDPKIYLEMVEAFCKAYDSFSAIKGGKPHVRLSAEGVRQLDPGFIPEIRGAVTMDEWGTDPFRLVVLNAKSAVMAGAQFFPRTRVDKILVQNGIANGLVVVPEYGERQTVRARTIVNLAGPWAPFIDPKVMPSIKMRPSKGVHLVLDRRVVNISMVCKAVDGRESVFILPHEHTTLIGTTDDDFYGHPDNVTITQDDVGYLMQAVTRYFPSLPECRIMRAFVGIRPTIYGWGMDESSLSREHLIFDHTQDGAEGLFTMIGGKLASYRLMAEELTDILCQKLKKRAECHTHLELLPGCTEEMPWLDEARRTGLDPLTVRRVMYRHGLKAVEIFDLALKDKEMAQTLCECDQVLAAEVAYCVREEWASRPADIRRRTRLGMGPCQSCRCADRTALFMGNLLKWNADEIEGHSQGFLGRRFAGNQPVLFGEQAKQEEYARYLHLMNAEERE
ncbi:MAG: glycerol-3-phosphate dehydrogenase/oxidase [Deltaproteobacteria bacterium]|nr:glycerol-3-phosphate dehydrogenase/oxidase [Deltaproteobacteria bacterium]MBI3293625.1 glycerol-3-phosphate dehydrogenase/oxidase [Deltaproteobacteria bacterium]